jgi:hypothetical protein
VNASGGGSPASSSEVARDVKIVAATATAMAPPICWLVLSRPEASPAWWGATPAKAAIVTGMNEKTIPTAKVRYAGSKSGQ